MFNTGKLSWTGILGLFIDLEPRLISAAHRGDEQKVRHLLSAGVSPNAMSRVYRSGSQFSGGYFAGDSALKVAGRSGRLGVVRLLLGAGATPDSAAIAAAGAAGHLNIVKILCRSGCEIDPLAAWVPRCLSKAVEEDDSEIAESLLRAGADPSWGGMYELPPLIRAARNGSHRLVDALLENNPVQHFGLTEWIVRALHAHPLAEDSPTTDVDDLVPRFESALPAAFSTHRMDVVCALLTVLSHFANSTRTDISQWPAVKRTLQDISADQKNAALHTAAKSGLRDATILLLTNGADPNAPDADTGETPLIAVLNWGLPTIGVCAPFVSRENVVAILIENGADVNAKGGGEESSLHAAVGMFGEEEELIAIVQRLLKAGAWVNGRVGENPPIQEAASRGPNTRLIRLLIDSGADVNAKDSDGKTLVQTLRESSGMDGEWAEIDELDPELIDILRRADAKELERDDNTNGFTPRS